MVKAWPGCLIPSLPSKNLLMKNEEEINKKRERYLNDFLKKMALRDYLYYSEEFQALLRSVEANLTDTFGKWPTPTPESIIIRYKDTFASLAGVLGCLGRRRSAAILFLRSSTSTAGWRLTRRPSSSTVKWPRKWPSSATVTANTTVLVSLCSRIFQHCPAVRGDSDGELRGREGFGVHQPLQQ
jgi:hypothetical protein